MSQLNIVRLVIFTTLVAFSNGATEEASEEACQKSPGGECGCGTKATSRLSAGDTPTHEERHAYSRAANGQRDNMVLIDAQTFTMGTDKPVFAADGEGPARNVTVDAFYLDVTEVSNSQFAEFVAATGFVTEAEKFGNSFVLESLIKNATLKAAIKQAVATAPWWLPVHGAHWRHPEGAGSDLTDRMAHPVVHVSWNDAVAFCAWLDKASVAQSRAGASCVDVRRSFFMRQRLPTEAEWEAACKSGLKGRLYSWGNKVLCATRGRTFQLHSLYNSDSRS